MCAERQFCNYAPTAATPTFERPKQLRLNAAVDGAQHTVRSHDLSLQQAGCCGAKALGKGTEAAALHKSGYAHRCAAATLHIATRFGCDGVVGVYPHCAG